MFLKIYNFETNGKYKSEFEEKIVSEFSTKAIKTYISTQFIN